MEKLQDEPDRPQKQFDVDGVEAEAPLWVLLPKMFFSVVTSFALIVLVFWLDDGEVSMFSFGFATFLVTLQVLMLIGFRYQGRTDLHTTKQPGKKLFDRIGGLWLTACAFGAFFGWVSGNMALMFPAYKTVFFVATVFFSIVLPIATMLPNLRYIPGVLYSGPYANACHHTADISGLSLHVTFPDVLNRIIRIISRANAEMITLSVKQ